MDKSDHFRSHQGGFRWDGVDLHAYKQDGSAPFKDVTRQTLFRDEALAGELRYFEVAPGGHSTLERHEHVHAVMILRGRGRCLVGDEVRDVSALDLVSIPPMTWHQFRRRRRSRSAFSAWSTASATGRNCRMRTIWPPCTRYRRSPTSSANKL